MKKYIYILMTVFLLAVMTACGGQESAQEQENKNVEEQTEGTANGAAEEKVVQHMLGETTIEGNPEKIASLMPWITDFLVSLDIKPFAAASAGPNSEDFSWYLEDKLENTENLGWPLTADIEMLLSIDPDLIFANFAFEKVYEDSSKIAPTVIVDYEMNDDGMRDMRKTLQSVAAIVEKDDEAKQVIAGYDKFVKEAKAKVSEAIGDESVMFLRVTPKELRYYSASNFEVLYRDLELQPPAHFPDNAAPFEPLSLEMLPEVNPDHIFLLSESDEVLKEMEQSPIWNNLTSVQNNQVYTVDYDLWFQGFGPTANKLIIEDAVEKLTN